MSRSLSKLKTDYFIIRNDFHFVTKMALFFTAAELIGVRTHLEFVIWSLTLGIWVLELKRYPALKYRLLKLRKGIQDAIRPINETAPKTSNRSCQITFTG